MGHNAWHAGAVGSADGGVGPKAWLGAEARRPAHRVLQSTRRQRRARADDNREGLAGAHNSMTGAGSSSAKERAYPELVRSRRCHLTVLGIAATFVRQLARCRARAMPLPRILAMPLAGTSTLDGALPLASDLLADSSEPPPLATRMP